MSQVAIVTGASRGIGAATARQLAKSGFTLCINYLRAHEAANQLVAEIVSAGGKAIAVQADTSDEAAVVRLFETVDRDLGPVTALVNNAGIVNPLMKLEAMDARRLERIWAVNITGYFLCAREAIKRMSTVHGAEGGVIVNVSSVVSRLGGPGEWIDYAASKGAIDTMTLGLAKELGPEAIRVNAVRPGLIETEIHASAGAPERLAQLAPRVPMQRVGSAEEVADTIAWLVSDAASYVTGALIDVSGGR